MATPHNIVFPQYKPDKFFENANDADDSIAIEIEHDERSVDQFIWTTQADLREHLVSVECNPRFGAF